MKFEDLFDENWEPKRQFLKNPHERYYSFCNFIIIDKITETITDLKNYVDYLSWSYLNASKINDQKMEVAFNIYGHYIVFSGSLKSHPELVFMVFLNDKFYQKLSYQQFRLLYRSLPKVYKRLLISKGIITDEIQRLIR